MVLDCTSQISGSFLLHFSPKVSTCEYFGTLKVGLEKGNDETQSGPVQESSKSFSGLVLPRALTHIETLVTLFST